LLYFAGLGPFDAHAQAFCLREIPLHVLLLLLHLLRLAALVP
jgi:hypothetical protein